VPLKISMITPRSRSVDRYATLAPPNSPLRITPFPRSACAPASLDELQLHVAPVLLGRRRLENFGDQPISLEPVRALEGANVTHLRYRVLR
jgi:hypothetical protein